MIVLRKVVRESSRFFRAPVRMGDGGPVRRKERLACDVPLVGEVAPA